MRTKWIRIKAKPGNSLHFHEIQMPGDLCTVFTGTPTSNRQKITCKRGSVARVRGTETGKSPIFIEIMQITKNQRPDRS